VICSKLLVCIANTVARPYTFVTLAPDLRVDKVNGNETTYSTSWSSCSAECGEGKVGHFLQQEFAPGDDLWPLGTSLAPGGELWLLGMNLALGGGGTLAPRDELGPWVEFWPLGMNLALWGELWPFGVNFGPLG
jgi:hypothetical protein